MSYATDIIAEDFESQINAVSDKWFDIRDELRNAKEGTHEYELLNAKAEALKVEYHLLQKLYRIQCHYNHLREHAEQMVRYFNGTH